MTDSRHTYEDPTLPVDYGKIRVGLQTLDDAVIELGKFKKNNKVYSNKNEILKALADKDYAKLREISQYYYEVSGIYERICKHFAFLYRYDWYVVPYIEDESISEDKVLSEFSKVLNYLDWSDLKQLCGRIALNVIKNGCYYGYLVDSDRGMTVQELPVKYCRSRYRIGNNPAVEFNMAFFDEQFGDVQYRLKVLKMFPDEFSKGYVLYKKGKLKSEYMGDTSGWYLLDTDCAFKINLNGDDYPLLVNAIPALIDLDSAQELDRKKMMQQLLKIVIQKLPLDKNNDLIFDVDEAKDIHNNAVQMLKRAVGVDVITTFADVAVENVSDKNTTTTTDELEKVERGVYNEFGVSENLFNSDGNIALNNSILNDEASIRDLILQLQMFLNKVIRWKFPGKKKYSFRAIFLETTIYNYLDLAKVFKEQVQIGYSKMLPQIALGLSQSSVIANAHFENEILHLYEIMIPPLMSSTMTGQDILGQQNQGKNQSNNSSGKSAAQPKSDNEGGRPEKADKDKSEKTIQNKESMK